MNLYQQIMFGLGAILLVFGMALMVFRSADGGLTKIKLPVVELELNGGALFVMVLGAGLMYFGVYLEASSPFKTAVAPDKTPNKLSVFEDQDSEKKATAPGSPSEEKASMEDDARRARENRASEEARKVREAEDEQAADEARRATAKQALDTARKAQELAKERAAAEESARRADEIQSLERTRKMAAAALEELQKARNKEKSQSSSQSAAVTPSPPVTQPASPSRGESVGSASLWDHNGSTMVLISDGKRRKFYYDAPREGLVAQGVHNGTLLFEGTRQGNKYSGTAYRFSSGCSPIGFSVDGDVVNEHEIIVRGRAPNRRNCRTTGYSDSTLRFTYTRTVSDYSFPAGGE